MNLSQIPSNDKTDERIITDSEITNSGVAQWKSG